MLTKISKLTLVLAGIVFAASGASAQTTNTNCTATSTSSNTANIDCTSTTPTPVTPPPTQSNADAFKQGQEMGNAIGAPIGLIIARKRAQHAQEKNDLVAVVYCRQNPTGSWTFAGKAPMPCLTFEKNVTAYCTVNPKTAVCKDVAKLAPPASAPVVADVHQVQPQPQPVIQQAPVAQPVQTAAPQPAAEKIAVVPQPQAQSQQMVNVSATQAQPEISVAEAARRNKAARQAQQASDNPQAQATQPQQP